jgi:hypothetical protein
VVGIHVVSWPDARSPRPKIWRLFWTPGLVGLQARPVPERGPTTGESLRDLPTHQIVPLTLTLALVSPARFEAVRKEEALQRIAGMMPSPRGRDDA